MAAQRAAAWPLPFGPYFACHSEKGKKRQAAHNEPLQLVRTAQKGAYVGKYEVLSGEASCKRRLSSL